MTALLAKFEITAQMCDITAQLCSEFATVQSSRRLLTSENMADKKT